MKRIIQYSVLTGIILTSCSNLNPSSQNKNQVKEPIETVVASESGYKAVNGIKMYYEIYGEGKPLILIHGGGSTIQSNFAQAIALFAKNRKVIAMELQAHGRTSDRNIDSSFEQDADDVAGLLKELKIDKADFFGFSNGGTTTMQIAIRHPEMVDKIVLGSALYKRNGVPAQFWDFMKQASLDNMPQALKDAYLTVNDDMEGLKLMHDRDAKRMLNFKDIPDALIKSIKVPTLIIIGDKDVITPEHALEMHRLIAGSALAIIPGGHGAYIGEITTLASSGHEAAYVVPMIESFLDQPKVQN
jgi:pimeloyl-ACP methyl ester carboxylesterase